MTCLARPLTSFACAVVRPRRCAGFQTAARRRRSTADRHRSRVCAVVADAPLERFAATASGRTSGHRAISRHALAHASVIEYFFRRAPVIPLKIFALFSADARVQGHLHSRRTRLRKLFAELRGLEEWGARVITRDVEADSAKALRSGRDYLQVKKQLADQNSAPSRRSVKEANAALKSRKRASKIEGV